MTDEERLSERVQARFHTVNEVAVMTSLSDDTIRRAISDGDLVAYKLRGQLRVRDRDFEAWVGRYRWSRSCPPCATR